MQEFLKNKLQTFILIIIGLIFFSFFIYDLSKEKVDPTNEKEVQEEVNTEDKDNIGLSIGNKAPDFTLRNLNGDSVKLSDFKGKKVFLNFWASWYPPCKAETPELQKVYEENKDNNFVVLSVNLTTAEAGFEDVEKFIEEYQITFPVVLDVSGSISQTFRVQSIPTSYMIDENGVIITPIVGPINEPNLLELMEK